jgi:hypothetical protein
MSDPEGKPKQYTPEEKPGPVRYSLLPRSN